MTMSSEGTGIGAGIDLSHDARQGVELIGMIGVQSETRRPGARTGVIGGSVDPQYLRRFAQAHEEAGFDMVLIGYASTAAEGFTVAGYAAAATERLRFLMCCLNSTARSSKKRSQPCPRGDIYACES